MAAYSDDVLNAACAILYPSPVGTVFHTDQQVVATRALDAGMPVPPMWMAEDSTVRWVNLAEPDKNPIEFTVGWPTVGGRAAARRLADRLNASRALPRDFL